MKRPLFTFTNAWRGALLFSSPAFASVIFRVNRAAVPNNLSTLSILCTPNKPATEFQRDQAGTNASR